MSRFHYNVSSDELKKLITKMPSTSFMEIYYHVNDFNFLISRTLHVFPTKKIWIIKNYNSFGTVTDEQYNITDEKINQFIQRSGIKEICAFQVDRYIHSEDNFTDVALWLTKKPTKPLFYVVNTSTNYDSSRELAPNKIMTFISHNQHLDLFNQLNAAKLLTELPYHPNQLKESEDFHYSDSDDD